MQGVRFVSSIAKAAAIGAAATCVAASAHAVVINFGGLSEPGSDARLLGSAVLQDGFRFDSDNLLNVWQNDSPNHPVGGTAATSLMDYYASATTTMTMQSGSPFTVSSIDLAPWGTAQTGTMDVTFFGTKPDTTVVQQTFTVANSDGATPVLQTFHFNAGFSGLSSLTVTQGVYFGSTGFQFNNVVAAPVPEPAALALMTGGLLGLAGLQRRRRRSASVRQTG